MKMKRDYIKKAYGSEPSWDKDIPLEEVDAGDVLSSINWYVTTSDKRNYKKWTLEWMKDKRSSWTDEDIDFAKRSSLKEFRSYGHYCRMLSRGFPHINQLTDVVESYITKLITLGKTKKESRADKVVISPQERMKNQVTELAGEMMGLCDSVNESLMNKTDDYKKINIYKWLGQKNVGYRQAEMLSLVFAPALAELDELLNGKDEQLMEGYSYLGKRQQKQLYKFMDGLVSDCMRYHADNKTTRKKKKIDPKKVVSKVQYEKSSKEFGIKSVDPVDILDSSKVVVYSTKYNTLSVYYACVGQTLSIKGTTIHNFDEDRSESRTIKKPKDLIKTIKNQSTLNKVWNSQHSMIKSPNGRLNANTVILKVF
tara:strand:+ start:57 stop:1160 length:1104 start_codon:yes stop_codon:yes gene_type:complete